jgi:hypothetical protein
LEFSGFSIQEKVMLSKKVFHGHSFIVATPIVLGIFGISVANAANPQCYNLASLQGNYAVITNYGSNVAKALGVRYFDGNGNFTGTFVINQPKDGSTTGERTLVTGSQSGTYTVNCDGTGVVTRIVTLPDATTATQADDFIITSAVAIQSQGGPFFPAQLIATAVDDAGRVPSPIVSSGLFVTHKYTRQPDRQPSP